MLCKANNFTQNTCLITIQITNEFNAIKKDNLVIIINIICNLNIQSQEFAEHVFIKKKRLNTYLFSTSS
jgi:hypothetical protein